MLVSSKRLTAMSGAPFRGASLQFERTTQSAVEDYGFRNLAERSQKCQCFQGNLAVGNFGLDGGLVKPVRFEHVRVFATSYEDRSCGDAEEP
jgi:hypothetical protein